MCGYFLGQALYTQGYGHRVDGYMELTDSAGNVQAIYMVDGVFPENYFKFTGDILSVACERSLEDFVLYSKKFRAFDDRIMQEYGLYFDPENKWNMSLYRI